MSVVFIMIAYNIGSACRVRKEDSESLGITQSVRYFFSFLKRCGGLTCLFVPNKGKFGKYFDFLNNSIIGHDLHHYLPVKVLRNSSKPKLSHQNSARLIPHDLLRRIYGHMAGIGRNIYLWLVIGGIGITMHRRWVRLIAHALWWIAHLRTIRFEISLHFLMIVFIFDIHFPSGIPFLEGTYDIMGKGIVALHGDKGIAKKVESSPRIISLDDPKYV